MAKRIDRFIRWDPLWFDDEKVMQLDPQLRCCATSMFFATVVWMWKRANLKNLEDARPEDDGRIPEAVMLSVCGCGGACPLGDDRPAAIIAELERVGLVERDGSVLVAPKFAKWQCTAADRAAASETGRESRKRQLEAQGTPGDTPGQPQGTPGDTPGQPQGTPGDTPGQPRGELELEKESTPPTPPQGGSGSEATVDGLGDLAGLIERRLDRILSSRDVTVLRGLLAAYPLDALMHAASKMAHPSPSALERYMAQVELPKKPSADEIEAEILESRRSEWRDEFRKKMQLEDPQLFFDKRTSKEARKRWDDLQAAYLKEREEAWRRAKAERS